MTESIVNREQSLGYLVNHAARLLARALSTRLAAHGVPLGQFPVLLALWEEDGLTQTEIARRLDIEQPSVANTLKRMERDGLVHASPDPQHGRRVLFHLTEQGHALRPALTEEAKAVNALAASVMSAQEVARLRETLRRLIEALSG